jgi:alcohol dehydrogenase class IV
MFVLRTRDSFEWKLPTQVVFGQGTVSRVAEKAKELGIKNPLLVTTSGPESKLAQFNTMIEALKDSGITASVWGGVVPEPTDISLTEGVKSFSEGNCDGLIAFGGGSAMDTAKLIGILVMNGGTSIREYMTRPPRTITGIPPLICLPTTSGTGSEVTRNAVVTDTSAGRKGGVGNDCLYPRVAIVDPSLTLSMPPSVTASAGMDALSHAIGCYTSAVGGDPVSDALALYSTELIAKNLRKATLNGQDMMARTNMSVASLVAGMAFTNGGLGLEHVIGHLLGAKYHVPHGVSCVLLLPQILEFILPARIDRLAKVAEVFGVLVDEMGEREAAVAAVDSIAQLMDDVGIPSLAKATGMTPKDVPVLAEETYKAMRTSPRPTTVDDFAVMYRKALLEP